MEEITFKRILRWTLASLIVVVLIAYGFGIGIASAESGSISFPSDYAFSIKYGQDGTNVVTSTLETFSFYNTAYNSLSYVTFNTSSSSGAPGGCMIGASSNESDVSEFIIVSGGSGYGVASYSKSNCYLKYVFSSNTIISSNEFTIDLTNSDFRSNLSIVNSKIGTYTALGTNNPIMLKDGVGGNIVVVAASYFMRATSVVSQLAYLDYNVTYPFPNSFKISITKYIPSADTKTIIHTSTKILNTESYFNDTSYTFFDDYSDGLYLNVTTVTGSYRDVLINSTGVPDYVPPEEEKKLIIDPETGAGIIFDRDDYAVGDIANITWSRIINTPFGDTDFIVVIRPDGTEEELISSPPDNGNYKVLMSPAGTWKVEFRRSSLFFGVSVLASDTATVGAETPSYIYAPVNVAIGKLFNVTYRIGFTPSSTLGVWVKTYRWIGSDWVYEQAFSATGAKNVETNTSILIKDVGKYLIKLCDVIQGCKASTSTTGYFNGTEPTSNITVSNITTDKASYSYGEYIATMVHVDNLNWSNKAISVDYLNYDTGITHNQQYIQFQVESFNLYVSDLVFPAAGNSALRLIGKNDTGTYVLAFKNFTLSSLDAEGYGLSVLGSPTCIGDTGQIKVVVPPGEIANLSISAENAKYNKEYIINGSKIVPYTFQISGSYYVTLRVNNEAKRLIIVNIGDCVVPTTPSESEWAPGSGGTNATCGFWDGWVGNLAGGQGVNDLTRFMFALTVIGMITAFVAIITKNLGAGVIVGFFPYAFFVFMSLSTPCGQYMPVWTAVFIAVIVGVKMRWF